MDIFKAIRLISINKAIDFYRSPCFNSVFRLTSCCYFCFHYISLRNGTMSIFGWSESKVLSDSVVELFSSVFFVQMKIYSPKTMVFIRAFYFIDCKVGEFIEK